MKDRIIKIAIFAVAILDCLLALIFSFSFNEDKKDNFTQVEQIQAENPTMLKDFMAATPETLPQLVETYQKSLSSVDDSMKNVQLQKDILYTYLQDLKGIEEESFEQYQSNFSERAEGLFAKADNKQAYVDGFKSVASFKDLSKYVSKVEEEYNVLKQNFLVQRNCLKAEKSLLARATEINATASANKKATDLEDLQNDIKSFNKSASLQNAFIILGYILGLITVVLLLWFALVKLVKNFRESYKVLLVLGLMVVVVFIGYLVGSSVLTPSAIKAGMSVNGFKMVNAACFTFYVVLLCAILAIIASAIMNAVKNRK